MKRNEYRPRYSWDYEGGQVPSVFNNAGVGRTLAKGDCISLRMTAHFWSETSPHLIVLPAPTCFIAIPASTVGRLLVWLRDQARPPRFQWHMVEFWLCRTVADEWVWFQDGSPESLAHLPWRRGEAEKEASKVMNS